MYAVFYRLGGYEETWRQLPEDSDPNRHHAIDTANVVQMTLRHIGYPFAQAEVRDIGTPPEGYAPNARSNELNLQMTASAFDGFDYRRDDLPRFEFDLKTLPDMYWELHPDPKSPFWRR
jgi:hypothetical protein